MKADDRDLKKAWKAGQKAAARAALPLSDTELEAMFEYLAETLETEACDHSRRFTMAWLVNMQGKADAVLAWLDSTGGFCDCEVVGNSRDHWETNR